MTSKIYLKGVRAYGYLGYLPEENVLGQWFEVDATLWVDFRRLPIMMKLKIRLITSPAFAKLKI